MVKLYGKSSQPTYEGLKLNQAKHGSFFHDCSQPTYEGLKPEGDPQGMYIEEAPFPAYL